MDDTTGIAITDDPRAQLEKRLGSQNLFRIPQLLLECVKIPPGWRGISGVEGYFRGGGVFLSYKESTALVRIARSSRRRLHQPPVCVVWSKMVPGSGRIYEGRLLERGFLRLIVNDVARGQRVDIVVQGWLIEDPARPESFSAKTGWR